MILQELKAFGEVPVIISVMSFGRLLIGKRWGNFTASLKSVMKVVIFLLQMLVTVIVGQTLFFKFSGAAESIYIFHTLGVEPWGRIGLGTLELLSIILLWIPKTNLYALLLILGMMLGAIASHLVILGIEIMGDKGELFILGLVTCLSSLVLLYFRREEITILFVTVWKKKHVV